MTLIEFTKYFYNETNRFFLKKTKIEHKIYSMLIGQDYRKFFICVSYFLIIISLLCIPLVIPFGDYSLWILMVVIVLLCFVTIKEAEFNVIKIYRCYKIYNKNDVYSNFLKASWFGSQHFHLIKNNLNVNGLKIDQMHQCFSLEYVSNKFIIPTVNDSKVILIFKTKKVILKLNGIKKAFKKKYEKMSYLFNDIQNEILQII